jgi:hypothetical protein
MAPTGDGKVVVTFVAEFELVPELSSGRFRHATSTFTMTATTEPFVPVPDENGYTPPFFYTWEGEGTITFRKGKN